MPSYTFACETCRIAQEIRFETFEQSEAEVRCPACNAPMVKRFPAPYVFSRRFKNIATDDGFGVNNKSRQMAKEAAAKAGVSTEGKYFMPNLVPHGKPFDPSAWVGDKDEVRERIKKNGWGAEELGIKGRETPPPEPVKVAPDIVHKEAVMEVLDHHGGTCNKQQFERIKDDVATRLSAGV